MRVSVGLATRFARRHERVGEEIKNKFVGEEERQALKSLLPDAQQLSGSKDTRTQRIKEDFQKIARLPRELVENHFLNPLFRSGGMYDEPTAREHVRNYLNDRTYFEQVLTHPEVIGAILRHTSITPSLFKVKTLATTEQIIKLRAPDVLAAMAIAKDQIDTAHPRPPRPPDVPAAPPVPLVAPPTPPVPTPPLPETAPEEVHRAIRNLFIEHRKGGYVFEHFKALETPDTPGKIVLQFKHKTAGPHVMELNEGSTDTLAIAPTAGRILDPATLPKQGELYEQLKAFIPLSRNRLPGAPERNTGEAVAKIYDTYWPKRDLKRPGVLALQRLLIQFRDNRQRDHQHDISRLDRAYANRKALADDLVTKIGGLQYKTRDEATQMLDAAEQHVRTMRFLQTHKDTVEKRQAALRSVLASALGRLPKRKVPAPRTP